MRLSKVLRLMAYRGWLARVTVMVLCFYMISSVQPRAILGGNFAVETTIRQLCVHTRLIDEVETWKIQKTLELVRQMGAHTIVEFFPWAYIEPTKGNYNWHQADTIIRHAQNQGLQVIARMGMVPEWARPSIDEVRTTLNYLPEESYGYFAAFVAQFANRYKESIEHIIIWNEPNLSFEWGFRPVDPEAYTRLLETVYVSVKSMNPSITIHAGALAPTLEPPNSPHGMNDILYLQAMYEAGAAAYFDALAVHTYGFSNPPIASPDTNKLNFRRVELLREIMESYGDEHKPVYITETGWNDSPRWIHGVRPSQRAQYTVGAIDYAKETWQWLESICLWVFRYPTPTYSYPDNYALVTPGFQIRPIYYVLQEYALGKASDQPLWYPPPTVD